MWQKSRKAGNANRLRKWVPLTNDKSNMHYAISTQRRLAKCNTIRRLRTRHTLPKGERPVYQKNPTLKAHWISNRSQGKL